MARFKIPKFTRFGLSNWNTIGEFKKEVKNRNPKNVKDLKNFCIGEWNKINPKIYFKYFIKKIKKYIKLKGGKLEDIIIKEIRKEKEEEEEYKEKHLKRIFNDAIL